MSNVRTQWVGIGSSYITQSLSVDGKLKKLDDENYLGIGGMVIAEKAVVVKGLARAVKDTATCHHLITQLGPEWILRVQQMQIEEGTGEATHFQDLFKVKVWGVVNFGLLFALTKAYPDLKANENFMALQGELTSTEDRIASARRYYNATVLRFNNSIQTFPAVILAGIFGFVKREFFAAEAGEIDARLVVPKPQELSQRSPIPSASMSL